MASRSKSKEYQRQYSHNYHQRPAVRERVHRYQQLPKVTEKRHEYRHRPEVLKRRRLYLQRPEVKERKRLYNQRPHVRRRSFLRLRKRDQRPEIKERKRLYRQTPTYKLRRTASKARHYGKGFIPLCSNEWSCPVDYHHVSPSHPYVVPLPRNVHHAVKGPFHFVFNASMIYLLFGLVKNSIRNSPPTRGEGG